MFLKKHSPSNCQINLLTFASCPPTSQDQAAPRHWRHYYYYWQPDQRIRPEANNGAQSSQVAQALQAYYRQSADQTGLAGRPSEN